MEPPSHIRAPDAIACSVWDRLHRLCSSARLLAAIQLRDPTTACSRPIVPITESAGRTKRPASATPLALTTLNRRHEHAQENHLRDPRHHPCHRGHVPRHPGLIPVPRRAQMSSEEPRGREPPPTLCHRMTWCLAQSSPLREPVDQSQGHALRSFLPALISQPWD